MDKDWFIEKLGQSQQKVMSLTVANRALERKLERVEARSELLEGLVMDVMLDLNEGLAVESVLERVHAVMQRLDADD
jgi:hypothetical protein